MEERIEQLIHKYLNNSATDEEVLRLMDWSSKTENKKILEEYFEVNLLLDKKYKFFNDKIAYEKFLKNTESQPKVISSKEWRDFGWVKYVAALIILVATTYFLENKTAKYEVLLPNDDEITLHLNDGKVKVINISEEKEIFDNKGKVIGLQKGNKIAYSLSQAKEDELSIDTKVEELVYNEINVPYGKTFELILSDGTQVYLNAGTSIKYPVQFVKGKNREIFIKGGEVYCDVTKDKNDAFIVNVNDLNVRVLGTKFNVSYYPEDKNISTVLVEGSVGLYDQVKDFDLEEMKILKPGYKADWNVLTKEISFEKVDTNFHTAWIEGKLIFKNNTFKKIRKKLERHYNVVIKNYNDKLDMNTYSGVFDVENIEKVMQTLNESYPIKYTIVNNEIIIN